MNTKPIKPSEVSSQKEFPETLIQAINEMIIKKWNGSYSKFTVEDLIMKYFQLAHFQSDEQAKARAEVHENKWLDFEDLYRQEGWQVEYDGPGFNESYKATFTFSSKKK